MTKTILLQFITHCAGTQDIIKTLSWCSPYMEVNVELKVFGF